MPRKAKHGMRIVHPKTGRHGVIESVLGHVLGVRFDGAKKPVYLNASSVHKEKSGCALLVAAAITLPTLLAAATHWLT